ncbi:MAG: iron-sulfur cluster assembly scaffold protein [Patescibacteria group bacterium]
MNGYTKEVMDHFMNPRNIGEIENADGIGEVGNMKCGDVMYVYIKIGRRPILSQKSKVKSQNGGSLSEAGQKEIGNLQEEFIEDIKFKTLGCAAAIASSSMMTELAKGKSLEEAKLISRDDINEALGILPQQKYHCSILSAEGIQKAITNFENNKKTKIK